MIRIGLTKTATANSTPTMVPTMVAATTVSAVSRDLRSPWHHPPSRPATLGHSLIRSGRLRRTARGFKVPSGG
jgi:hypothetical protein